MTRLTCARCFRDRSSESVQSSSLGAAPGSDLVAEHVHGAGERASVHSLAHGVSARHAARARALYSPVAGGWDDGNQACVNWAVLRGSSGSSSRSGCQLTMAAPLPDCRIAPTLPSAQRGTAGHPRRPLRAQSADQGWQGAAGRRSGRNEPLHRGRRRKNGSGGQGKRGASGEPWQADQIGRPSSG